jgi:hypothetical protein
MACLWTGKRLADHSYDGGYCAPKASLLFRYPSTYYSTFQLRDARSKLITQHTKNVVGRLIRLTIQTGAFTSLLALTTLVLSVYVSKIGLFQTFP